MRPISDVVRIVGLDDLSCEEVLDLFGLLFAVNDDTNRHQCLHRILSHWFLKNWLIRLWISLAARCFAPFRFELFTPQADRLRVLETPTLIARLHNVAVMSEPVQQCRCHLGVAKYIGPLREVQIGRDHHAGSLV